MGEPPLDLAQSRAKLARAREHLDIVDAKVGSLLKDDYPLSVDIGPIDEQTGWATITVSCKDVTAYHLGVYVGDVIHNLRCALDYIVARLVVRSGEALKHQQFPIFDSRTTYFDKFGDPTAPKIKDHSLKGVQDGLVEIESLQPYHRQGDCHQDPLWRIHRFSNADKHREISTMCTIPKRINLSLEPSPIETLDAADLDWAPESRSKEIRRVRFSKPYPSQLHFNRKISTEICFVLAALSTEAVRPAIGTIDLRECCAKVESIIDLFAKL